MINHNADYPAEQKANAPSPTVEPARTASWQAEYASGVLAIDALAPDILRFALAPTGSPPHRTWSVAAVAEETSGCDFAVERADAVDSLRTPGMTVTVTRAAPRFTIARADGSIAIGDVEITAGDGRLRWVSALADGARVFGGGERTGPLDKRGRTLTFWATDPKPNFDETTDAMYQSVPFVIILDQGLAHGIFFDSSARATLDLGAMHTSELAYETTGPDLVAYFFAGPTLGDVLRQYTAITGRAPMPPRWALGNQQSRWSYATAEEALAIAKRFRAERIPCDALHLDIDYMDGFRDFTWNTANFPDARGLIRMLGELGFRVVTIIDPGIKVDESYHLYQDGAQKNYFVRAVTGGAFEGWVWPGRSVWADFAQPEVVSWWGEQHRGLVESGVAGIWIDMNEPTQADMWAPEHVHIPHGASLPLDAVHGPECDPLSHADFHNAYAIEMARATYEGLTRLAPERRSFVLTRAAGAGSQRYAAVWNGDTTSSWAHLRLATSLNLGAGLSGFALTGGDIGGFWEDTTPALLARWTQLGALLPFCRNHSAINTARQEPWAFGEPYTSVCRAAIELRYRLLPIFVTLAHEAARSGAPIVRPLAWIAPQHSESLDCDDEFLLGDNLLVAPIVTEGAVERRVTLPPGEWFEWGSDVLLAGAQQVVAPAPLDRIPLFVRAGSILPIAGVTQSTQEQPTQPLELHIYLSHEGQSATAEFWDDDDHPQAEQRGSFAAYTIHATWRERGVIEVSMERTGGDLALRYPGVDIRLHLASGVVATEAYSRTMHDAHLSFTKRFVIG